MLDDEPNVISIYGLATFVFSTELHQREFKIIP